jgi:hypothetical protein
LTWSGKNFSPPDMWKNFHNNSEKKASEKYGGDWQNGINRTVSIIQGIVSQSWLGLSGDWVIVRDPPDPCLEPFQVWIQSCQNEQGLKVLICQHLLIQPITLQLARVWI